MLQSLPCSPAGCRAQSSVSAAQVLVQPQGTGSQYLLESDLLVHVHGGLVGDEGDQLLHALLLAQEIQQAPVLGLAFLQDVILVHQLLQGHILLVQQLVHVRRRVQIELPEHGGGTAWGGETAQ